jgi:hypothetical protein
MVFLRLRKLIELLEEEVFLVIVKVLDFLVILGVVDFGLIGG